MSNNSNVCPKLSPEVISFSYWSGGLGLGTTNVERASPLQQFTIAHQALASLPLDKGCCRELGGEEVKGPFRFTQSTSQRLTS